MNNLTISFVILKEYKNVLTESNKLYQGNLYYSLTLICHLNSTFFEEKKIVNFFNLILILKFLLTLNTKSY